MHAWFGDLGGYAVGGVGVFVRVDAGEWRFESHWGGEGTSVGVITDV